MLLRTRRVLTVVLPLCLAACLLAILYVAWNIWTFDSSSERTADAAIILGAATRHGEPSPIFVQRIDHGVDLYRSGRVSKLLFTGGVIAGEPISLAESAGKYAVQKGVPADAILLETKSRTTLENVVFAKELGQSRKLETYLIVSNPLHLKRTMRMARDLELSAWPSATPTSAVRTPSDQIRFLARETYFYIQYCIFPNLHAPPNPP